MKRLLSTKVLSDGQKALLPREIHYSEYDAIRITSLPVPYRDFGSRIALFSSRNAVLAFFGSENQAQEKLPACCCVGEKTAALLREHGLNVLEVADNAGALAAVLIKKYNDRSFVHYCGNRRREELSRALQEAGIPLEEVVVYRTDLEEKAFDTRFDVVLFYSPSGVQSFVAGNPLEGVAAVCIGPTTAAEAARHTDRIIIAGKPSVEAVVQASMTALV